MVISHGPEANRTTTKEGGSEIEIFNGEGLFKKKKRVYNRNSILTSLAREAEAKEGKVGPKMTYQDEESLESILELEMRKMPKSGVLCEI